MMKIGEPVDLLGERGLLGLLLGEHVGDVTDLGPHPGRRDEDLAVPARDVGVHERHVGAVTRGRRPARRLRRRVFSTATLSPVSAPSSIWSVAATITRPSAGTRSPASSSTMSPGTICSTATSVDVAVAAYLGRLLHHLAERGAAASALPSWCIASQALNTVSTSSPRPVRNSPMSEAHDGGDHEHDLHVVRVVLEEPLPDRARACLGELVRAVLLEPGLDLRRAQALRHFDVQALGRLLRRQRVPRSVALHLCAHGFFPPSSDLAPLNDQICRYGS